MSDEDYGFNEDDAKGGGGGSVIPRGKYTGALSRTKSKKDTNGKVYLGFGVSITAGKLKKVLAFENYLPLARTSNAFQVARRNSFLKAIGLKPGSIPPGAPGGPKPETLDGTIVDFSVEHVFENVPGQEYALQTSKSAKTNWVKDGWEDCLDSSGRLVRTPSGKEYPAPISPKAIITFYELSDDFEGIGGGDDGTDAPVDDDDWG